MQVELLDRRAWKTRIELANVISWGAWRSSTTVAAATACWRAARPIAYEMLHSTERRVA
jgi:hypothetical protein